MPERPAWTPARMETLRKLWCEGASSSEIVRTLGGVTRNAVIGKLHRLGLAGRATPARPKKPTARRAPKPAARRPAAPVVALDDGAPPVSILAVGAGQCRAIVDDSDWGRALMCGRPTAPDCAWCAAHRALFYTRRAP